jgi:hypothetical protein
MRRQRTGTLIGASTDEVNLSYEELDQFAEQLEDGRWVLASFNGCADEWYAVPILDRSHPITAATLEDLARKRKGVWKGTTREQVVTACWREVRHQGNDGEWLEAFQEEGGPILFYVTARNERGWVPFETRALATEWMRWQVSAPFLSSRGFKGESLDNLRALEAEVDRIAEKGADPAAWWGAARAWLALFEQLVTGTRLARRHWLRTVEELFEVPEVGARFARHLGRLGLPPAKPAENLAELEAMLCDELGLPGAFDPDTVGVG